LDKSDSKSEHPSKPPGKRTFDSKSTIFKELPIKQRPANPHRIPDHKDEWFYEQSVDAKRRVLVAQPLSKTPQKYQESKDVSPHRLKK
jgi:hypothetical protein